MAKRRKVRGPRDPTESHDFSVTRCDFWTSLSGGTRRDDTSFHASVTFRGTLSTPIRATTVIEVVVYQNDQQSYRSIDEAPAYVNRTTQKPVAYLDLGPEARIALFLPRPDFDRLWVIAAADRITDGHFVITAVKWRRAEVRSLSLASKAIE
jgi:hypothetical protein